MDKKFDKHLYKKLEEEPNRLVQNIIIIVLVSILVIWSASVIDIPEINDKGKEIAKNIVMSIFHPNTDILFSLSETGVPALLIETLAIAFLGTLIGAVLAIPLAFLSSKNIVPRWVTFPGVASITFIRTFPVFIIGLMFISVSGPGPMAGVLTMAVTSVGMIAKLYIDVIEDLNDGIIEFLDSAGCNTTEKVFAGVFPQLMTNFISITIYRFEINVKNASVLGLVGAGGIGYPLLAAMGNSRWNDASAYLIGLIFMVIVIEIFSTKIRARLSYGK